MSFHLTKDFAARNVRVPVNTVQGPEYIFQHYGECCVHLCTEENLIVLFQGFIQPKKLNVFWEVSANFHFSRCQLSVRVDVHILWAEAHKSQALGHLGD
jgi:hypothetical protein